MQHFAIHSNRTVTPSGIKDATVIVKDGIIDEVIDGIPEALKANQNFTDVGHHVLMPGIIDPHVHINEPGRTEWEGFDTATRAALAGGVTTIVDMPLNSSPVTTNEKAFHEKLASAQQHLHANCGFWGGVIPGNAEDIEPLIEAGVQGFKAFLIDSGIDEFPAVTESDLRKVMPVIARHGLPLLVHCEKESLTQRSQRRTEHNDSYGVYLQSRPRKWENDAIALMIRLCEEYNCRTHVVHLSSSGAVEMIADAKQRSLPITVETGQHYLHFTAEDIHNGQTQFKCAPPIREEENNVLLWKALKDGIIDFVASDHSPCPPEMKDLTNGNFMRAWGGISSIQFALPALWTAAKRHGCTIENIAQWLCDRPASFIGTHKKGRIEKGCDADLVVWSPEESFTVQEAGIHQRHKVTPYLGRQLTGVVKKTFLHGKLVFDHGEFVQLNSGEIFLR